MAEFFQFLSDHWMLSTAFGVSLILFIINELKHRSVSGRLNPQQAVDLMNHQDAAIIDLRHTEAYREGHIVNAKNIPAADLDDKLGSLSKYKQKALLLICEQGMQSPKVASKLKSQGFEQVYFITGGLISWKADNLPLTKKD